MKPIIVDARFVDNAKKAWGGEYDIIPSFTADFLPAPICAHPDLPRLVLI